MSKQTDHNGQPITYWGGLAEDKKQTSEDKKQTSEDKKQTAVDFLVEQLLKKSDIQHINGFDYLVEQAKAMEIDQHQTSFNKGYLDAYAEIDGVKVKGFEEYFTETYEQ